MTKGLLIIRAIQIEGKLQTIKMRETESIHKLPWFTEIPLR